MVEERFTDTCIDESDGSMRHLPSESGIDLMSYHSQNPIEYQDKAYHTYHQKKDFDAFLPKPSDVVYKRKQQWDGAHSDDELELSRRMESWVHGVDRGNVNPGDHICVYIGLFECMGHFCSFKRNTLHNIT